ncbi:MAG: FAD-dependent oxidoreductase [Nevskia sp.]|nr:FAD-dependent oxidoreductase [Nevskia sp.]
MVEQAAVRGLRSDRGRIAGVATTQGELAADEVLLALGAWSPEFGRQLGLRLPIQPGKGYSITYSRPQRAPRIPLVLQERSVCVTAWDSGYRLGSTMEFSGYDSSLNPRRLQALKRGAAEYLEQPEGPAVEEQWQGWRPMTYDDLPIIGRAPGYSNLSLATGHGMLGVSLSAITAQLVTELLTGRAPSLDLAPCSPLRFT